MGRSRRTTKPEGDNVAVAPRSNKPDPAVGSSDLASILAKSTVWEDFRIGTGLRVQSPSERGTKPMATGEHQRFGSIFDGGSAVGLSPAQLLGRFTENRDEAAFSALVAHHGPMVLATCRRILANPADADDAFQATFLVLAKKAKAIGDPDRLAPWLHGVARRVSVRSRSRVARRKEVESEGPGTVAVAPPPDDAHELRSVLDEELSRLPEKYRAPLVLCYLGGLTHDEAAEQLRWPVGTLRSRMAHARDRLRTRLARRGFGPPEASLIPLATIPRPLIIATVRAATVAGTASTRVLFLAQGALIAMMLTSQIKTVAVVGLLVGLATGGAAVLARHDSEKPGPKNRLIAQSPSLKPAQTLPKPAAPKPTPENYPLTVSGRALDSVGKPIPGARVYLASCAIDDNRRLAETRTDEAGFYKFRDVLLPIRPDFFPDRERRVEGVFEVFGQAEGFGFAWLPSKTVRFAQRVLPLGVTVDPTRDVKPGEPVVLDLTFPPPSPLSGRVVDDRGKPLPDAKVRISYCDKQRKNQPFSPTEFVAFRGTDTIPIDMKTGRTDAEGNFIFDGLPPDHRFQIDIQPTGFPERRVLATMMPQPQPDYQGQAVLVGPLSVVFATPREVPFRVITGDTGRPAPKAFFSVGGEVSDYKEADADGQGKLQLPPGEYVYSALPRFTTPYLETRGKFTVPADGPIAPFEVALRPACILEVTVTAVDTGQPIADVDLWEDAPTSADPSFRRKLLAIRSFEEPNHVHSDRPKTDAKGKLRTLAEPGPRRVGVGFVSRLDGRVAVETEGQGIDGKPGQTLPLTFTMRKRP